MNRSFSVGSVLVALAVVSLLLQGFRMSPSGWFGLALKLICGTLIVIVVGLFCWNTAIVLKRPK